MVPPHFVQTVTASASDMEVTFLVGSLRSLVHPPGDGQRCSPGMFSVSLTHRVDAGLPSPPYEGLSAFVPR